MGFEKLYYWEDPVQTGILFGTVLVTLISICYFSLISVISYTSLLVLMAVIALKIYTYVMVTFLKKEVVNPVQKYAGVDVTIPGEKVSGFANCATEKINKTILELRRLFLVDNMIDSIKFGLSLWFLTYIGSWFNMMTLIILFWVALFTIPKVYQQNKAAIDPILEKVKTQYDDIMGKVNAMLPSGQKPATEAKKEE
jgi:ABC-type bacteriocin/lantibiotic exporter with double-glycine peptidase domain